MSGFSKAVLTFGLVAAFTTPAWAQGRGGGMGMGMGGGIGLIAVPSVQKELKLEDDQVEKARGVAEELQGKMRESFSSLQDLEGAERMKKMQELTRTTTDEGMKALGAFLKPEQLKRFKQIVLQQQGPRALADPEVAKKLKVTDEQKGKVRDILAEAMAEQREARESAGDDRAAMMEKSREIQKKMTEKALALMTDDQKKEWKEMTGEPFEVRMEGRPGGGGAGRPRTKGNNN